MSDTPPEPEPVQPGASSDSTPGPTRRWRDRVLGFRGAIALALASLIVGGLGGAAITAVADHDDRGDGGSHHGGRPDAR